MATRGFEDVPCLRRDVAHRACQTKVDHDRSLFIPSTHKQHVAALEISMYDSCPMRRSESRGHLPHQ